MEYAVANISEFSDSRLSQVFDLLSPQQQAYIKNKPQKNARQSLAARALLARLLSNEVLPVLHRDDRGRPLLQDKYISLSHSGDFVAAAVSLSPVGIDIQLKQFVCQKTAARVCCEEEIEYITASPDGFFTLWTLKEAYIKAAGAGFATVVNTSFIKEGVPCSPKGKSFHTRQGDLFLAVVEL